MAAALLASSASAHPESSPGKGHPATCDGLSVTSHIHRNHTLIAKAYSPAAAKPDAELVAAAQVHRRCIRIAKVRHSLGEYRDRVKASWKLERLRYVSTPYAGPGGTRWAIPYYIASCESGGGGMPDYHVGFAGAYGVLTSTWQQWGGPALSGSSTAGAAKPIYQDIIAHQVWVDVGPSGWECA